MMTHEEMVRTQTAALWEEAKGKLRAACAVRGSMASSQETHDRWLATQTAVEEFISHVEDNGLME